MADKVVGEYLSEIGKRGGRSRSDRKRETARENAQKARESKRLKRLGKSPTP